MSTRRPSDQHAVQSSPDGDELLGIAGSHGVVMAPAVVMGDHEIRFPRKRCRQGKEGEEWERFVTAVAGAQTELRDKIDALEQGGMEVSILDAYVMMVGDETLAQAVHTEIYERRRCADWAVAEAASVMAGKLAVIDDPYMRERSHDIQFVGNLLLRALGGRRATRGLALTEPSIVVAHDLSPADTAAMVGQPVVGFVTEVGSRTSHTSIMARALEIPAVVGVKDALELIEAGEMLVVDGLRGRVVVAPNDAQIDDAERRAARFSAMSEKLDGNRDRPATTQDGVRVRMYANIELPEEATIAVKHGAEGVGLYRTEFMYINRTTPPDEDEQLDMFQRVMTAMGDRPITLRTFDIGGDKFVTTFELPGELNPMLGLRAVRLALTEREVFLTQLRAMVRAAAGRRLRIMVPLLATVDELTAVRSLLDEAMATVAARGGQVAGEISLGAMIEVPAAAVMADRFARAADFMSIGTNDLVQYALAVDRTNRALAHLASPYDPAILRLIHGVIRAGREADCPVSVCGEMASEPFGALLLIGLGIRDLSMESVAIPEIKEAIDRVTHSELSDIAKLALDMSTAAEVETLLTDSLEGRLHDIITGMPDSVPGSLRPQREPARSE